MVDGCKHTPEVPLAAMAVMRLMMSGLLSSLAAGATKRAGTYTVTATYEDEDGTTGEVLCDVSGVQQEPVWEVGNDVRGGRV